MNTNQTEKAKTWQAHFDAAKTFSGSIEACCKSQGLEVSSFYYWRKKLNVGASKKRRSPFLPVAIPNFEVLAQEMPSGLPDARWVGEMLAQMIRGLK